MREGRDMRSLLSLGSTQPILFSPIHSNVVQFIFKLVFIANIKIIWASHKISKVLLS